MSDFFSNNRCGCHDDHDRRDDRHRDRRNRRDDRRDNRRDDRRDHRRDDRHDRHRHCVNIDEDGPNGDDGE